MNQSPTLSDSDARADAASDHPRRTALVLGGGGSAGNAWLIGIVAGLFEGGLDVTDADLIVGTSAGATAAAQITAAPPSRLLSEVLDAAPPAGTRRPPARPVLTRSHLERTTAVIAASSDPADMRQRMGAALAADAMSGPEGTERWRRIVADDDRLGDEAQLVEAVGNALLLGDDALVDRADRELLAVDGALPALEVDASRGGLYLGDLAAMRLGPLGDGGKLLVGHKVDIQLSVQAVLNQA